MDLNFRESADFFGLSASSEPDGGSSQPDFESRTFEVGESERGGVQNVPCGAKVRGGSGFILAASEHSGVGRGAIIPAVQIS